MNRSESQGTLRQLRLARRAASAPRSGDGGDGRAARDGGAARCGRRGCVAVVGLCLVQVDDSVALADSCKQATCVLATDTSVLYY
eukprot:COSAG01_NODE_3277_length_6316_cov_10.522921_2_plen_85_part_00